MVCNPRPLYRCRMLYRCLMLLLLLLMMMQDTASESAVMSSLLGSTPTPTSSSITPPHSPRRRTTLIIAHRLSTIQHAGPSQASSHPCQPRCTVFKFPLFSRFSLADCIIVMNHGVVAESGTHLELLARPGGLYAAMWSNQLQQHRHAPQLK